MPEPAGPHQLAVPLLISCPRCQGTTFYETEDDGLCACVSCENGWKPVAVPLSFVLSLFQSGASVADSWAQVVELAQERPITHSVLHTLPEFPRRILLQMEPFSRQQFPPTSLPDADNVGAE